MLSASRAIAGFSPSYCRGTRAATPANLNAGMSTIRHSTETSLASHIVPPMVARRSGSPVLLSQALLAVKLSYRARYRAESEAE